MLTQSSAWELLLLSMEDWSMQLPSAFSAQLENPAHTAKAVQHDGGGFWALHALFGPNFLLMVTLAACRRLGLLEFSPTKAC